MNLLEANRVNIDRKYDSFDPVSEMGQTAVQKSAKLLFNKERAWNKLGNWRSIFVRIQGVAIGA